MLKEGERRQPDDDLFASCYHCGNTYPIYQAHIESEIKDSLETVDNPFESNDSHFETTKRRKYKKNRLTDKYYDDDPDIAAEQKRYGSDNVRIIR